ncbi:MAG: (Fe-S)-binding protein, partial [Pseudomonadota bacterium]
MTTLPDKTEKSLGLAIDLDTCVGCHACVVSCKEWNTGAYGAPLADTDPYGADPSGAFLNRVHT